MAEIGHQIEKLTDKTLELYHGQSINVIMSTCASVIVTILKNVYPDDSPKRTDIILDFFNALMVELADD